jgi:hypothetical protein
MYKNKYNDDIAPDRRYIQIEYKTAVVEGERFIVSARVNGLLMAFKKRTRDPYEVLKRVAAKWLKKKSQPFGWDSCYTEVN